MVVPRPPNPQKKLQPGSQWVLKPPAGPCCELTASAHQCETRNSATKCLMGKKNRGKQSTGQQQVISVCNFTFFLVCTGLFQGELQLSFLLSLQITSLTETSVVFMQGMIFCLCVNREPNFTSLEKVDSTELS